MLKTGDFSRGPLYSFILIIQAESTKVAVSSSFVTTRPHKSKAGKGHPANQAQSLSSTAGSTDFQLAGSSENPLFEATRTLPTDLENQCPLLAQDDRATQHLPSAAKDLQEAEGESNACENLQPAGDMLLPPDGQHVKGKELYAPPEGKGTPTVGQDNTQQAEKAGTKEDVQHQMGTLAPTQAANIVEATHDSPTTSSIRTADAALGESPGQQAEEALRGTPDSLQQNENLQPADSHARLEPGRDREDSADSLLVRYKFFGTGHGLLQRLFILQKRYHKLFKLIHPEK